MSKEEKVALPELQLEETIHGKVVKIFAATCNEDSTEGRGRTIDHSYHFTEHDALVAASGIGGVRWQGRASVRTPAFGRKVLPFAEAH